MEKGFIFLFYTRLNDDLMLGWSKMLLLLFVVVTQKVAKVFQNCMFSFWALGLVWMLNFCVLLLRLKFWCLVEIVCEGKFASWNPEENCKGFWLQNNEEESFFENAWKNFQKLHFNLSSFPLFHYGPKNRENQSILLFFKNSINLFRF